LPHQECELPISDDLVHDLSAWYEAREKADEELRRRANVASHFVHYAINADRDVERYIHFFVALDALFGGPGRVASGILDGVLRLRAGDPLWTKRATGLYKLRNDLVHGGASTIETWGGIAEYERQFGSRPLDDVATIAMAALARFFAVSVAPARRKLGARLIGFWKDISRALRRLVA
jgi:hypothetical protein